MPSCDKPIAECVQATNLGEGIEKAVMIKNLSHLISDEIWTNNLKNVVIHSARYFNWQVYEKCQHLQSITQRTIQQWWIYKTK